MPVQTKPKFEVGDIVVFTEEMLAKSKKASAYQSQGPFKVIRCYEYGAVSVVRLNGQPFSVHGWTSSSMDTSWGEPYFRLDVFLNEARKAITNAK